MSITDPHKGDAILMSDFKVPLIDEQTDDKKSGKALHGSEENPDVELDLAESSEQNAGFLNSILFCFVVQYLWKTRKAKSDEELLEKPIDRFKAKNSSMELERVWNKVQTNGGTFFSAVFRAVGSRVSVLGVLLLVEEAIHLAQPIFMGRLMAYFRPGSQLTQNDAYTAALGVALTSLISPVIHHPYFHGLLKLGSEMKCAASGLLYQKGLKLSSSSVQQTSTGQLINLLSTDVIKFDTAFIFIHYTWLCPILLVSYGYVIWSEIGAACIAGFLCLFCLIFVQGTLSRKMGINRGFIAERADNRLSVMNEIISGIRVIKMYAWEGAFSNVVNDLRNFEIKKIQLSSIYSACVMGVFFTSGKIALLCALLVYIYLDSANLTAERIFVASALYNSCRLPFSLFLPLGFHFITEVKTTCARIENFLKLREHTRVPDEQSRDSDERVLVKVHDKDKPNWIIDMQPTDNANIKLKNVTTKWVGDSADNKTASKKKKVKVSDESNVPITYGYGVRDATVEMKSGECIAVVGQVGSGKSSLLSTILGEATIIKGQLEVYGKIAYCSQEAWIYSGTVRDNILFGSPYIAHEYAKAVEICNLLPDFDQLVDGDMTEVGDKGSTLSGGQRARVALARAIYSNADIYLLDDPLSAVDANVGQLIYKRVIQSHLKDKLVVLVTHQIQYLEDLEKVILMNDGAIVGCGKISLLKEYFSDLFVSLEQENEAPATQEVAKSTARSVSRASGKRTVSCASDRKMSLTSIKDMPDVHDVLESLIQNDTVEEDEEEDNEDTDDTPTRFTEQRGTGSISFAVYWAYIKEMSKPRTMGFFLVLFVFLTQLMFNFVDWWLQKWMTAAEKWNIQQKNMSTFGFNDTDFYDTYHFFGNEIHVDFQFYQYSFTFMSIFLFVCGISRCIWFRFAQIGASRRFHSNMFKAVVNTDVAFFDNNSVGRILNRFSKDMNLVDDQISFVFFEFVMGMLSFAGLLFVIIVMNPMVLVISTPIIIGFIVVRQIYTKRSRDLKRIEATTRSPMNTHVSATLMGLPTIRAYGKEKEMLGKFYEAHDMNVAAFNMTLITSRWFAVCIDILVASFITAVAFVCVWQSSNFSSGEVALMLLYAVQLTGFFSWIMRQSAELQNGMVSVERIVEYTKLKSEHEMRKTKVDHYKDDELGSSWPTNGAIKFVDVNVSYAQEKVLNGLTFEIMPRQKIGIAGRTGAGKSTLLRVLFGLKEPTSGQILIDDVDTDELSLQYRRKGMAIIPQEPVLFIGTVRRNLDPFDEFDDEVLWNALEQCELKDVIGDMGGLSTPMQEGGSNFSVGQRQLVCLARALIHHAKILVIDEATANVDGRTDAVIQKTIRTRFASSTVLTIAHRLNTIMESDKIMVFEKGNLIEFDSPKNLMDNTESALWQLAVQSGSENAMTLRKLANDANNKK